MHSPTFYLYIGTCLSMLVGDSYCSIRCYSCNGYYGSSTCTLTTDCSSYGDNAYCYKKTADRVIGGQTTRVTLAGCRPSCTLSDKEAACSGEKNCEISCCTSNKCNRVTSKDSTSPDYPKCHSCESTSSYVDCASRSVLKTCSYSTDKSAHCYKTSYMSTNFMTGVTKRVYKKDCTTSPQTCIKLRSVVCSGYSSSECEVHCCSGNACNAGAQNRVSAVIIVLPCVLSILFTWSL